MSDVSGCELRSKIPPNATAREFVVITIIDARKTKLWPWRSAQGSNENTGDICIFKAKRGNWRGISSAKLIVWLIQCKVAPNQDPERL